MALPPVEGAQGGWDEVGGVHEWSGHFEREPVIRVGADGALVDVHVLLNAILAHVVDTPLILLCLCASCRMCWRGQAGAARGQGGLGGAALSATPAGCVGCKCPTVGLQLVVGSQLVA